MTPSGSSDSGPVYCDCCDIERPADADGWVTDAYHGTDLCPGCHADLQIGFAQMVAALPDRIGLCPDRHCADEFYMPLTDEDGEHPACPTPGCGLNLVIYTKATP